jgi:hypothetical protein
LERRTGSPRPIWEQVLADPKHLQPWIAAKHGGRLHGLKQDALLLRHQSLLLDDLQQLFGLRYFIRGNYLYLHDYIYTPWAVESSDPSVASDPDQARPGTRALIKPRGRRNNSAEDGSLQAGSASVSLSLLHRIDALGGRFSPAAHVIGPPVLTITRHPGRTFAQDRAQALEEWFAARRQQSSSTGDLPASAVGPSAADSLADKSASPPPDERPVQTPE